MERLWKPVIPAVKALKQVWDFAVVPKNSKAGRTLPLTAVQPGHAATSLD
jgi:hypothetical protein